jgi:hypothetical protein
VPSGTCIELVEERIVDHAQDGRFLMDKADGDTDKREAVDEVGRSVCGRETLCEYWRMSKQV